MKLRKAARWNQVHVIFDSSEECKSTTDEQIIEAIKANPKYESLAKQGGAYILVNIPRAGNFHAGRKKITIS